MAFLLHRALVVQKVPADGVTLTHVDAHKGSDPDLMACVGGEPPDGVVVVGPASLGLELDLRMHLQANALIASFLGVDWEKPCMMAKVGRTGFDEPENDVEDDFGREEQPASALAQFLKSDGNALESELSLSIYFNPELINEKGFIS